MPTASTASWTGSSGRTSPPLPSTGAANQALLRLVADELGVPKRDVRLVAGAASRTKLVVVDGVEAERVLARWPGLRL